MTQIVQTKKIRADLLLLQRKLAASRHQAQSLIMAGRVWSKGQRVEKAGDLLLPEVPLEIEKGDEFVSRGGKKLAGALGAFQIDPTALVCVDIGASTGGFTDCLLQRGANKVYAIDVGHGQLHPKLRGDPRVIVMEKKHARDLMAFPERVDLAVIDVSFISLTKVLPAVAGLIKPQGRILALVKPQFELSPKEVKKGVVREAALRGKAVETVKQFATSMGLHCEEEAESVLPGPKGNREIFLLLAR